MASRTFSIDFHPISIGVATASTTKTLTIYNSSFGIIYTMSASTTVGNFIMFSCTSRGAVTLVPLTNATNLLFSIDSEQTNTVIVENKTTGTNPQVMILLFYGSLPTLSD